MCEIMDENGLIYVQNIAHDTHNVPKFQSLLKLKKYEMEQPSMKQNKEWIYCEIVDYVTV